MHRKYILMYIQQDTTLHSLFYVETALHVSGGTTTHHQERKQLYLQHLVFVTPLLLPAAIAAGSSNAVTNTRCCRYSCMRSWWWVEVPPETFRTVSRYNKLCNVAPCWIYIGINKQDLLGQIGCPKTSVISYQSARRNVPEDRRPQLNKTYTPVGCTYSLSEGSIWWCVKVVLPPAHQKPNT